MENERITICLATKKIVYEDCTHIEELETDSRYKYKSGDHGFLIKDNGDKSEALYPWNNIIFILKEKGE